MMQVTVFSNPGCYQCEATKRHLTRTGVKFDAVLLTDNHAAYERLHDAGWRGVPVIEVRNADGVLVDSWDGYRPGHLDRLAAA